MGEALQPDSTRGLEGPSPRPLVLGGCGGWIYRMLHCPDDLLDWPYSAVAYVFARPGQFPAGTGGARDVSPRSGPPGPRLTLPSRHVNPDTPARRWHPSLKP